MTDQPEGAANAAEEPWIANGCRVIIDLEPIPRGGDPFSEEAMESGEYEATMRRVPLPSPDDRNAEEPGNPLGTFRTRWPDDSMAAAGASVGSWAARAWRSDANKASSKKRRAEREKRRAERREDSEPAD